VAYTPPKDQQRGDFRKKPKAPADPKELLAASSVHSVENDAFDRMMFAEMLDDSPVLTELKRRGETSFSPFGTLLQDLFSSLYKYNIRLTDSDTLVKSNLQNRSIVEQAMQRQEFRNLRKFTIMNEPSAAVATYSLATGILSQIQKEMAEEMNDLHEAEQQMSQQQDEIDSLEELLENYNATEEMEEKIRERLEQAKEEMSETQERYQQQVQDFEENPARQSAMERALQEGFDQALNDVKDSEELLEGFGEESGKNQRMAVNQRLMLARKLQTSDKLKRLAKMVGKFKRLALAEQRRRVHQHHEEMYDVTLGNDVSRLIPAELFALRHPVLRKDFMRRFVEGKLLQYNLRGDEERGKGALVVCIDGSYSMEGEKELWSKAVTLAMLDIATRQKRNFRAIHFGSKKDPLTVMEFPKNEQKDRRIEKIEHLAEYFIGGGTDFEKPLQEAIYSLERDDKQRGDIVFITDGDCVVSSRWLAEFKRMKEDLEVTVFSILVDMGINTPATVKEFSDKVTTVSRLTSEEMKDIFAAL